MPDDRTILVLNDREAAWAIETGMVEGRDFIRQQRMEPIPVKLPDVRGLTAPNRPIRRKPSYRARLNARRKDKYREADLKQLARQMMLAQARLAIDNLKNLLKSDKIC